MHFNNTITCVGTQQEGRTGAMMDIMACLLVFILLLLISCCKSDDQLTPAKPLNHGDMLVSKGGVFALGFFYPTSSNTSSYLGIWYHGIPGARTVVWVANRDNPVAAADDSSSPASLAITNTSDLVLSDSKGRALWMVQNNVTAAATGVGAAAVAVLLDTGNLVVRLPNGTDIWQSFDHPTDTILPGMRIMVNFKAEAAAGGGGGRLVAWKGPDDPSSGDFSCGGDPSSSLQIITWHGARPYYRIAVLNGATVTGGIYRPGTNSSSSSAAASSTYEIFEVWDENYYMFRVSDASLLARGTLDHTGALRGLVWNNRSSSSWTVISEWPATSSDIYAACGPFGYGEHLAGAAAPACRCLDGFEPVDDGGNFSRGCQRREPLRCGQGSSFVALPGMKVPDKFLHVQNRSFDQCAAECSRNCSCTAYAYANMSSAGAMADPSRCLVWTGELVDASKFAYGENLYLRLADSPAQKGGNLIKVVLLIATFLVLLTCIALVWICKYRGNRRKKKLHKRVILGYLSTSNRLESEDDESMYASFEVILAATDNFSNSNLLGRGGFGKVYKGILKSGKEVAVKRLSEGSAQGMEEFKNEVVVIAKLQHRNLVRLYDCCIHEDEKLLIYEYMPNKSLDAFLFDAARKYMLDWLTRFKIIRGIARGILYLHHDSRLTIIHRDLKASNILLDMEMNPKISDFGMARIFGGSQQQENTTRIVGTYGYMSPEYVMGGSFSVKTDIYSFGVLLLEIVSGLKISSPQLIVNCCNLTSYAWRLWNDGRGTNLVDPSIVESCPLYEALRCIQIGLLCVQDHPDDRPLMSSIVFMLENESALLLTPKQPAYFAPSNHETKKTWDTRNIENSVNAMSITKPNGR